MRPNKAGPSTSVSAPGLGGANLYEIADRQRHRFLGGLECAKRQFPSRSRTGSAWPASIQARLFI